MEQSKTVKFKSKRFAVRIVNLYKYLCAEKKEFVLSKTGFTEWDEHWCKHCRK